MRSGLTTVPLQSTPNASPFWLMLLLSSTAFGHGMIEADRTPGTAPDYESGGQEFESLRARQLSSCRTINFEIDPQRPQTKISV